MGARIDMVGQRFGAQEVIAAAGVDKHGQALWLTRCGCGNERPVQGSKLRKGESISCGCMKPVLSAIAATRHGNAARGRLTPEYRVWSNLIFRCENAGGKSWEDYGGRGIRVCERWRRDFGAFLMDMGPKPSPKHEIDRIDVNGDYDPMNCRWVTRAVNARNKRNNRYLEAFGQRKLLVEWAEDLGAHASVISGRLSLGWSVEDAVTKPVRHRARRAA